MFDSGDDWTTAELDDVLMVEDGGFIGTTQISNVFLNNAAVSYVCEFVCSFVSL